MSDNSNMGRPALTEKELDEMFRKMEPYLKSGLSINKSARQAGLPPSTVYDQIEKYPYFSEKIEIAKQFFSVMVNNSVVKQLRKIVSKQDKDVELNKHDLNFLKWLATKSTKTTEEFGDRSEVKLIDPQQELKKLMNYIDEAAEK